MNTVLVCTVLALLVAVIEAKPHHNHTQPASTTGSFSGGFAGGAAGGGFAFGGGFSGSSASLTKNERANCQGRNGGSTTAAPATTAAAATR